MVIVIFSLGLIFGYIIRRSVHEYIVAPKRCPYTVMYEVSMFAFNRTANLAKMSIALVYFLKRNPPKP